MRFTMVGLLVLLVACPAQARQTQEERRRAQVAAATSSAVQGLYDEIARQQIVRTLSVEGFLDQTGGREELMKTLQRAEQIGGPRWIDEQTCQVHLEIDGPIVIRALTQIAAANPGQSPVAGEEIQQRLKDWEERTFSSTGTSTGATRAEQLRPNGPDAAWDAVSDDGRRAAVAEARRQAVSRAADLVRPVRLRPDLTLGEVLDQSPEARSALEEWIADQPVTAIRFREDLQVELTVAVPVAPLIETLQTTLEEHTQAAVDELDWEAVQEQLEQQVAESVGHGRVPANGTVPRPAPVELPRQAPVWVGQEIDADAIAPFVDSRLKTARAAESEALARLQQAVKELPLVEGMTVGEAAEHDPNIKASLERALARASAEPPHYAYGGTEDVRVRVTLHLRHLWEELRAQ
jgi:hypothetical protein